jgi:capsule polysaccharide export protein KpsE/RkpR
LLIILTIVSVILGTIFSSPQFIPPKYKSTAIVYPVNISSYSVESETEQMMQVFESSEIRDYIIDKYDLYKHWDIDEDNEKARYYMLKTYSENITISRTNYESAIVTVMDYSPDTAKLMADDILAQYNLKARELAWGKAKEYLLMAEEAVEYRKNIIDSLSIELDSFRSDKNILDYNLQIQEVTQGLYRMLANGKSGSQVEDAKLLLNNLEKYGGKYKEINILMDRYITDYASWNVTRNKFYNDATQRLTYLNIIESPEVPVKKSYPVRWVILLSVVMGTLLFAVVLLSIFQKDNF